jgi:hypothetical protein
MQNYSMKKYETFLTICITLTRKKLKIEYNFLSKYFQILRYTYYAALCFLLIKAKLIPFIYHKKLY